MLTGKLLSLRACEEIAAAVVERDFLEEIDLRDDAAPKVAARSGAIRRSVAFARFAHKHLNPTISPKAIGHRWSIRLDNFLARRGVKGIKLDYVGELDIEAWIYSRPARKPTGTAIHDLKTSGRSPAVDAADDKHFLQMTSYALGTRVEDAAERGVPVEQGRMPERVQLDYLVDLKRGIEHRPLVSLRDDYDLAALFNRIEITARSLQAGLFPPASRDHWVCSKKWCGYYSDCPYVRNQHTIDLHVPDPKLYCISPAVTVAPHGAELDATDE